MGSSKDISEQLDKVLAGIARMRLEQNGMKERLERMEVQSRCQSEKIESMKNDVRNLDGFAHELAIVKSSVEDQKFFASMINASPEGRHSIPNKQMYKGDTFQPSDDDLIDQPVQN